MESDAGSSVARRRRRLSAVYAPSVSLLHHVTLFLHEFLVGLGFLSLVAVASCWRCCRCSHFIIWLLFSPSPSVLTALVPDLFHMTSPYPICDSQISDLKLLQRVLSSSSYRTMNFLPSGKIIDNCFCCVCGSRTNHLCSLFARSTSLNDSEYYYRTTPANSLPHDDLWTIPWLLQSPFEAAHTNECPLFLSFSDHNGQWLSFGSVKSPWLQHGNAGVGSLCVESTLVPLEVGVKPISLSAGIKMKSSLKTDFFMVKIHSTLLWDERGSVSRSFNAVLARLECFRCSVHKCQSLQAMKYMFVDSMVNILRQCSIPFSYLRFLKLNTNSSLKPSHDDEFNQTSSRQGRERSFFTSSFSKERNYPSISLFVRGDPLPVSKIRKNYQFPSRLLSCVKVRLGPVDATILIWMRVEVLDGVAMSYSIVTNRSVFEDLEVWFESFIDRIASGYFDIFHSLLSNFYKFVSLSPHSIVLYVQDLAFWHAHRGLYDVATTRVIA